ncbi:helix-turn-helix transcriptional regulator [[Clostridium] spiroforme]|nr:helix-turn-helix transcriptional regulator [Thomasclavelia spiroformis]MBM6880531.1 helix-turn-helix transcriptional regulator [Thomasclavelia spiroformis]
MKKIEQLLQCIQNNDDHSHSMLQEIFPGVYLYFTRLYSQDTSYHHEAFKNVLAIEYCYEGRIGWTTHKGNSVYLGPGDFAVHTLDNCTNSSISLPNGYYKGISIYIDNDQLHSDSIPFFSNSHILFRDLINKFCQQYHFASFAGNEQTAGIFTYFFHQLEQTQSLYWKIKTIELLAYLLNIDYNSTFQLTEYRAEQVAIIRQIHDDLISHLEKRLTIDSLSRKYLMNATTMKAIFKDVYGDPIATHIKKHRMNTATKLLLESDKTITEIAKNTGYESASKFARAFKEHYQLSPNQFRKQHKKTH